MSIASLTKGASSAYCWATSAGPDPLVIEPVEGERHSFTVVWLHGIGASAKDSKKVMSKMAAKLPSAKFVCPEAPTRLMKAQNFVMRAWWDINKMNLQISEDRDEVQEAAQQIMHIVQAEVDSGIDWSRIVLGGFSQGAALALWVALAAVEHPVGCVVMQCGYNALARQVFTTDGLGFTTPTHEWKPQNLQTPVWFGKGDWDQTILDNWSTGHYQILRSRGVPASLFTFQQQQHAMTDHAIEHMADWINQVLSRGSVPPDPSPEINSPQLYSWLGEWQGQLDEREYAWALNVPMYEHWNEMDAHKYKSVLFQSAVLPDIDSMIKVLKAGCPLSATDANGRTALHLAMANGVIATAQHLLNFRADPNVQDKEGNTPIHLLIETSGDRTFVYENLLSPQVVTLGCNLELTNEKGVSVRRAIEEAFDPSSTLQKMLERRDGMDANGRLGQCSRWLYKNRLFNGPHPLTLPTLFYILFGPGIPFTIWLCHITNVPHQLGRAD